VNKDRLLSASLVLFIIIFFIESGNIPEKAASQTFGSAFYPRILLAILGFLTILLIVKSFILKRSEGKKETSSEHTSYKAYIYVVSLFVITGIYIYLIGLVGFLVSTFIYLIASQIILIGLKRKKHLVISITSSLVIAFSVYFIFENYLNILLP